MKSQIDTRNNKTQKFGQDRSNYLMEIYKKKKRIIPSIVAGIVVAMILTAFFYMFSPLRCERNLTGEMLENEKEVKNMQDDSLQNDVTTQTTFNCPTCVDQIYDWDGVKEFYSIKVEEASWVKFRSNKVGISFEYPIEGNKLVLFEFNEWPERDIDPSGIEFSWSLRDIGAKYGSSSLAWGASRDLKIGRMGVDIYNWTESEGVYYINSTDGNKYKVEKIFVREVNKGGRALLHKYICFFSEFCNDEEPKFNILVVNLPENHRKGVESVLFKIPLSFTDLDIERLINSIDFVD